MRHCNIVLSEVNLNIQIHLLSLLEASLLLDKVSLLSFHYIYSQLFWFSFNKCIRLLEKCEYKMSLLLYSVQIIRMVPD
jgi:hypothetical protein